VQKDVERELAAAKQALSDAQQQLEQFSAAVDSSGSISPVLEMQRAFALGQDTAQQRQAVNLALRRMGLRVTIDSAEGWMELQLGEGAVRQRHQMRPLDRAALYRGDTLEEVAGLLVARREADFAAELRRRGRGEIQ
jgi:hypothetical protein